MQPVLVFNVFLALNKIFEGSGWSRTYTAVHSPWRTNCMHMKVCT